MFDSDIFGKLLLIFLAMEILVLICMKISKRNIFVRIFIVTGNILQIYWEFFMLAMFSVLAFKAMGGHETINGIKFSFEIKNIFWFIIDTLIFLVLTFLPYGLNKCLYWWCYEERKISERWIIPSFVISIVTVLIYVIGTISDFLGI